MMVTRLSLRVSQWLNSFSGARATRCSRDTVSDAAASFEDVSSRTEVRPASDQPGAFPWLRDDFQRCALHGDKTLDLSQGRRLNCVICTRTIVAHSDLNSAAVPRRGHQHAPHGCLLGRMSDHRRQRLAEPMRIGPHSKILPNRKFEPGPSEAGRRGFLQRRPHFLLHIQQGTRVDTAR